MQITIEHKKENQLIKRTDVTGKVVFTGATPSNKDLGSAIAKHLHVEPSLLVLRQIHTTFSHPQATFHAVAYATAEGRAKYEVSTSHLRKKAEEEKKAAEGKGE